MLQQDDFNNVHPAKTQIQRIFSRQDAKAAKENLFTAEAQRAQRINFLFVGRRRQTKT
jgi:hypothetical protein